MQTFYCDAYVSYVIKIRRDQSQDSQYRNVQPLKRAHLSAQHFGESWRAQLVLLRSH